MRLLLDTHVMIWWDGDSSRLSDAARNALLDPANTLVLSVVSLWEMQIKAGLGKLELASSLESIVERQTGENGLEILHIVPDHVFALDQLPSIHRDPFDRLLVAQAQAESLTIVTADDAVGGYPVPTLW